MILCVWGGIFGGGLFTTTSAQMLKRDCQGETDAISDEISAVLETLDLVDHTLVSKLGV